MKLTEVSVDGYGVCNNLRLTDFDDGLNVVYGPAAAGKSTVIRYIRNVLFGFGIEHQMGHGALEVSYDGGNYRLLRTPGTDGRLVITDLRGSCDADAAQAVAHQLSCVSEDVFDQAFVVSENQSIQQLLRIATTRCGVPLGRDAAFANADDVERNERQKHDNNLRLSSIDSRIADLENRRQELNHRIDRSEFSLQVAVGDVDTELKRVADQLQRLDVAGITAQIRLLDDEISELQNAIDASHRTVARRPTVDPTGLAERYRRLDEIDDQIRRWRQVHTDIQQQRVQLKNEMLDWQETGIESDRHPYHRAQEIVTAIESKVGLAEQSAVSLQNVQIVTPENNAMAAERLNELCNAIRVDLYELCEELGDQFKQIRHRAAAAELKRLRRCYEEIGDHLRVIIDRRNAVVSQIRDLDPEGARLIERQDQEFCRCALHDGYLQARRRYGGPIDVAEPTRQHSGSFDAELRRLAELREIRAQRVDELVSSENRTAELESRRRDLLLWKERTSDRDQLDECQEQFRRLQLELTELQKQRRLLVLELEQIDRFCAEPANALSESASNYVAQITQGEIQLLRLAETGVIASDGQWSERNYDALNRRHQHAVRLGISMAIAEVFSEQGNQLPVLVDNAFAVLDDDMLPATLKAMSEFCRRGHQLIAFTGSLFAAQMARRSQVTTLDLPETSVSPVGPGTPIWKPERIDDYPPREPEFLTPFTTRMHANVQTDMNRYPQVKYPPSGLRFEHNATNFDGPVPARPSVAARPVKVLNPAVPLSAVGVFDSMDIEKLHRLGVESVAQLLQIDPDELPVDFVESHIPSSQVDQWQALCWLIVCVPGLDATDARILYAIGISEPEQLETSNSSQLIERINRFLRSADGQSFATMNKHYDRDLANRWYEALDRTRSDWRMSSGYSRKSRYARRSAPLAQNDGETARDGRDLRPRDRATIRVERDRDRPENRRSIRDWRPERETRLYDGSGQRDSASPFTAEKQTRSSGGETNDVSNLKFYLQTSDDLEAAPSIGPKTSERFAKINVRTIAEFLTQTAESMAAKIKYKRITAEVIRQWQHQARLVCRIPNLRGHDAQLLVACGITEPEDLAGRQPLSLFKTIEPFAKSKEGMKIIRGGKQPDLDEVANWINWARQTRSLQAA